MTGQTNVQLVLPQGMNYGCVQCGMSCGQFWEIPVDDAKADEIRARPATVLQRAGAQNPERPVIESPWTRGRQVMRLREDTNHCCLLGADNLCTLHKAWGATAKPNICRSFPYRFIEAPDGRTWVGVSFSCTSVLGNLGPAVAGQRAELADLHGWTFSKRRLQEPIALATDLPLSWGQYEQVEADLDALLDPAFGEVGRRLVMQSVYLTLLARLLRTARREAGTLEAGPEANEAPLAVFRRQMHGSTGAAWAPVRRIAARHEGRRTGGVMLLRRQVLSCAHALRNPLGRRRGRLASWAMIAGLYMRGLVGWNTLELPGLSRPVPRAELERLRFEPTAPELDALLTRYFRHRLFRKDLAAADDLRWGHQLMLLHWGLLYWYAAALASDAGADALGREHVAEGLRMVEKFYVFHSTFERLFADYPLLRGFLERLFDNPLYAFAMSHGEWVN